MWSWSLLDLAPVAALIAVLTLTGAAVARAAMRAVFGEPRPRLRLVERPCDVPAGAPQRRLRVV
ncbi:MAG: hypothetical protein ACE5GC_00295 [Acidimicrobiia bacterium]